MEKTHEYLDTLLKRNVKYLNSGLTKGYAQEMDHIDFQGSDLNRRVLENTTIAYCKFDNMTLEKTDFYHAKIDYTTFRFAELDQVVFRKTSITNCIMDDVIVRGCNCKYAMLQNVFIKHAQLEDINLEAAMVKGIDLTGTSLKRINVEDAYISDVCVSNILLDSLDGIDRVRHIDINIGTIERPDILYGQKAIDYLKTRIKE